MGPWGSQALPTVMGDCWASQGSHMGHRICLGLQKPHWGDGGLPEAVGVPWGLWGSHGVLCDVHSASPGCSSGRNFHCPEPSPSLSPSQSPSRHPVVVSGWVTPAPCARQALAGSLRPQPHGAVGQRGIPIRAARPRVRGMKDAQTKLGSRDLYCGLWPGCAVAGKGGGQGQQVRVASRRSSGAGAGGLPAALGAGLADEGFSVGAGVAVPHHEIWKRKRPSAPWNPPPPGPRSMATLQSCCQERSPGPTRSVCVCRVSVGASCAHAVWMWAACTGCTCIPGGGMCACVCMRVHSMCLYMSTACTGCMCMCAYTWMCAYMCMYAYACVFVPAQHACACACVCTHTSMCACAPRC